MKSAPVDHVRLQIPAERRLSSIVRAAVLTEARTYGLALAQAAPLARAVSERFRGLAEKSHAGRPFLLNVFFDRRPDELRVLIDAGRGRRSSIFRAKRKKVLHPQKPTRPLRNPSV